MSPASKPGPAPAVMLKLGDVGPLVDAWAEARGLSRSAALRRLIGRALADDLGPAATHERWQPKAARAPRSGPGRPPELGAAPRPALIRLGYLGPAVDAYAADRGLSRAAAVRALTLAALAVER